LNFQIGSATLSVIATELAVLEAIRVPPSDRKRPSFMWHWSFSQSVCWLGGEKSTLYCLSSRSS